MGDVCVRDWPVVVVIMGNKRRIKSQQSPGTVTGNEEKRTMFNDYTHTAMSQPSQPIATTQPHPQAVYPLGSAFPNGTMAAPPYYSPTQFYSAPVSPAPQTGVNFQLIQDKLECIDQRLKKLDTIEQQLSVLSSKIESVDNHVTSLEKSVNENNKKELEISRNVDAQLCSELQAKQTTLEKTAKRRAHTGFTVIV